MDLNGDGIIEMGEENYYETPPNDVTYFLDIFAVADQEYRDYYKLPWDSDSYKYVINFGVDGASVYFMEEFNVKLKVIEISDVVWNSDDAKNSYDIFILLDDVMNEFKWKNNKKGMDTLIAFTGKDPYIEGGADHLNKSIAIQIPEIDDPEIYPYVSLLKNLNIWPSSIPNDIFYPGDIIINYGIQYHWDSYLIQHEVSHIFEAYDYGLRYQHKEDPISNNTLARINGIMDKTTPLEDLDGFFYDPLGNIWFSHEWNPESVQIINSTKMIKTNGPYIKNVSGSVKV